MILPDATLFPQSLLPIRIFEARYRHMLMDALESHRMLIVAMQKPECVREAPTAVAGLGVIRVCVQNPDGTSHLILQGIQRVELVRSLRRKPYRVHSIRPLETPPNDSPTVDALMEKVRDLVSQRIALGKYKTLAGKSKQAQGRPSVKEIVGYLKQLENPETMADLVSSALLTGGAERQTILETVEVEPRLRHLVHFLMAEIRQYRKKSTP